MSLGLKGYAYLAVLLVVAGLLFNSHRLSKRVDSLLITQGQLETSNKAYTKANEGLQGSIKLCNDSVSTLKSAGEKASEGIALAQKQAEQTVKSYNKRAAEILAKQPRGTTDCEKAKDVLQNYFEEKNQ